jgi:hypothetical protein
MGRRGHGETWGPGVAAWSYPGCCGQTGLADYVAQQPNTPSSLPNTELQPQ